MDDMLIGSKSLEEHEQHLREVLSRMEEHGIVLNGEKCMLGVSEVQFLGHMVSACGIIPLSEKVLFWASILFKRTQRSCVLFLSL